jgi:hypothetical protein
MIERSDVDNEVELGEDVTDQFVGSGKKTAVVVSTRLERDLAEQLFAQSEAEGRRVSQTLREAVVRYLAAADAPRPDTYPAVSQVTVGGTAMVTGLFHVRLGATTEGSQARELVPGSGFSQRALPNLEQ